MTGQADMLFVVTEKERFCLLRYQDDEVQTVEAGDLHDRACRPIEKGQMVAVDPFKQVIALHMVQGLIKLIPMDIKAPSGVRFREPINRRIEELQVLDIAMLEEGSESTLAILHETVGGGFRVKTYKVNLRGKEFEKGWDFDDLDRMSRMLIAVPQPRGGILVISDESIFYYNNKNKMQCAVAMRPTRINCYCRIDDDGHRFLLADSNGCLYVLILFGNNNDVESLKLEYLGQTVIASTLTYLDNGFVYVGSQFGDAQIIRLSSSRLQDGNFIEIADSLPGSGPIVDFITVDLEKIGQVFILVVSSFFTGRVP